LTYVSSTLHDRPTAWANRFQRFSNSGARFKLSLRDLVEMMAQRGLSLAHTTTAKAFFRKAIKGQHDAPRTITLDGYAASHRAVRELKADGLLPAETKLRSSKYLNNLIEQDHRGVKQRIATMLGFKGFATAAITIAGIELMHRIRKGQFGLGRLGVQGRLAPAVWNAVLRA
jgi:transposase-like protein